MIPSRSDLDAGHLGLLDAIYDHFAREGRWPLTRVLRKKLSHYGYIESLVPDLGPELIVCSFALDDRSASCRLGPEALFLLPQAARHCDLVVTAVRYLAKRYSESVEHETILSAHDLSEHAGLSHRDLADVCELIRYDDLIAARYYECTAHPCTIPGFPDIELSDALVGMAGVADYEDFLDRRREYRRATVRLITGVLSESEARHDVVPSGPRGSRLMAWLEHEAAARGRLWVVLATIAGLALAAFAILSAPP